jgi:AcrR family transcriptional regulator
MANPLRQAASDRTAETGLRQRQKARRRARIIEAGRKLFFQQGYCATSMEAIAELAEVGIATVYNYFGSKGRLLAGILQPDLDTLHQQGAGILSKPPEDPVSGILSLVDVYWRFLKDWEKKDVLFAAIGPGLSAEPVLDELTTDAETKVKQQLEDIISAYQKRKIVRSSIDVTDAAMIIFYIFNQHFIEYVTRDDADYKRMKRKMDRQIRFIVTAIRR